MAQASPAQALLAAAYSREAMRQVRVLLRAALQPLALPGQQRFPSAAKLGLEAMPAQETGLARL
jgi:hypothetical protein